MNIDDRLEALTQSVELLTLDMRELQKMHRDNEKIHAEMMLAIARLANTAQAHNEQLADHQERMDKLEGR